MAYGQVSFRTARQLEVIPRFENATAQDHVSQADFPLPIPPIGERIGDLALVQTEPSREVH